MDEGAEQEPETASDADLPVTCITACVCDCDSYCHHLLTTSQADCWLSGSEDTQVRRYPKNANECDGYAASANGVPIRCLAIDTQGRRLAVGSEWVTLLVLYH